MKRIAILLMLLMVAALAACSGDDGAEGPVGPAGKPQTIKVVILGSDGGGTVTKALWFNSSDQLPVGSTLNYIDVVDSIPPVSVLRQYDCAIYYANNTPADPAALGDRLADYVDAGGKLVLLQASFSDPYSLTGRVMTANYSPMTAAGAAGDGGDKTIDAASIAFPLHKIFIGIDIFAYLRPGNGAYSVPGVQPDATVLAQFNGALVAVAINARKTIIAINDFPGQDGQSLFGLAANSSLFLAGKI